MSAQQATEQETEQVLTLDRVADLAHQHILPLSPKNNMASCIRAQPVSARPTITRSRSVGVSAVFRLISRPNVAAKPAPQPQLVRHTPATPAGVAAPVIVNGVEKDGNFTFHGVHHVALICSNLERSLEFYQGLLGMEINPDRPHNKLPYRGAWLWIGPEMIHLMELPNPDPVDKDKRPEHGGRDRHFCIGVANLDGLAEKLDKAGVTFTRSMSGRPAIFFRDPDMNCLECVELEPWR
eukprot:gene11696-11837_t